MSVVILDIRTPEEFARGHVRGAINIPTPLPPLSRKAKRKLRARLYEVVGTLSRLTPVYAYCKKGKRAQEAVDVLEDFGFVDVNNIGGIEEEPLPSMVRSGQLTWV